MNNVTELPRKLQHITVGVTPITGFYNIFALCLDCEHATGESYRVEPCVAILLQHIIENGELLMTETVFASRDDDPMMAELIPAYRDMSYCGTITKDELDAGRADELVSLHAERIAEMMAADDGEPT